MSDFLSAGQSKGLAYQHDWDKGIDMLYRRSAHETQVRQEREQKTQYYAKLLEKKDAKSPYNSARLDNFYRDHFKKIGDFIVSNPNFESDIGLMSEFQTMASQIQDNDIIREELQVQNEIELLRQNRSKLTEDKFNMEMARYDAYINQDPSAEPGQKADPYFFNSFLVVDPNQLVGEAAKLIGTYTAKLQHEGQTVYGERFRPEALNEVTWNMYNVEENRHAIDSYFNELDNKTQERYKGSSYEWYKSAVKATEDRNFITSTLNKSGDDSNFAVSPFARHFARNISSNNLSGASSPANVALTPFARTNSTLTLQDLAIHGGAFIRNSEGELMPFDIHGQYTSMAGGGTPVKDPVTGQLLIGIPVKTSLNITESVKQIGAGVLKNPDGTTPALNESENKASRLSFYGFQSSNEVTAPIMDFNLNTRAIKETGTIYTGVIYVPMQLDESAVERYNKETVTAGVDEIKKIDRRYDTEALSYLQWEQEIGKGFSDMKKVNVAGAPFATAGRDAKTGRYYVKTVDTNGNTVQKAISKQQYDNL